MTTKIIKSYSVLFPVVVSKKNDINIKTLTTIDTKNKNKNTL